MNKKKHILVVVIVVLIIAAAIAGAVFAYLQHQKSSLTADVESVSDLSWYYGGEEMTSYGMVTNDFYQDVYLIENQSVTQVHVEEGQEVKAGDPLLTYDMTLNALQLEMKALEVESLENKLVLANRELERLRKVTPVPEYVEDPEPEPEPDPEPDPEPEPELPQTDPKTGAYNYLAEGVVLDLSSSFRREEGAMIPDELDGTQEEPEESEDEKEETIGTPEEPCVILCMPGCYVEGSYLNVLASSPVPMFLRLQIINPNNGKPIKDQYWDISSGQFAGMTFEEDAKWSVETRAPMIEPDPEPDDTDWYEEPDDMFFPEEPEQPEGPEVQTYTAKELSEAIKKEEKEIKDLDLQVRKAKLELEQMQKVSDDGVVKAEIDGIVKTVGDPSKPPQDGSAFITVSGSEGLYVTGSLSELQLGEVQVGQTVYANSWESGLSFEATIQEISPYPSTSSNSFGEGNPNVSYYPYTAYIANTEGLKNGEYVDLRMTAQSSGDGEDDGIYLQKAYVREENGRSYVMMADENDRLKKQYVETGKVIYGEAVEIKSGLTKEDRIAFPYGKTAKEGAKVEEGSGSEMGYY